MLPGSAETRTGVAHVLARTCAATASKASAVSRSQGTGGPKTLAAPLVVGDRERLASVGAQDEMHLQREPAAAARIAVRVDHLAQLSAAG